MFQDLRHGVRSIWRSPGYSSMVILTLTLGIGANTAIFSVVHAVLLSPPPYPAGERLVEVWESTAGQNMPVTWINFQQWRRENHTFEDLAGMDNADLTWTGHGDAAVTHAGVVSADFFRLTGWTPITGRLFSADDDRIGAAPVVLLTGEFWARTLGGNPNVMGTTLALDGKAYQVIGILPPGLKFFTQPIDFYVPIGPKNGNTVNRSEHGSMVVLGLLKTNTALSTARADLDAIMIRLGLENDHRSSVAWLADFGADDIRQTLLILMGAVGLVLTIACANVAGLMLVRSTTRVREMAIRSAVGASPSRLARQLLTESLVISALGGGLGVVLAASCVGALVRMAPSDIPRLWDAKLNLPVLCFAAFVTVMTALLSGLAPACKAGKNGPKQGHALRSGLVVAEISLALVLSFACVLLVRSLVLAQTAYPGFDAAGVLALEVRLPPSRYKNNGARHQFYLHLMETLRREPGVTAVGAVNCPPSTGGCARGWYSIHDLPAPPRADVPLTLLTKVDSAYFQTMRITLLAGRGFTGEARNGVIINETLARHWWKAPYLAIGHRVKFGGPYMEGATYEIVGVAGDVKQAGLDAPSFSEVYVPLADNTPAAMVVMIRGVANPSNLMQAVRRDVAAMDRDVPIVSVRPFEQWMQATLERRRFSTLLLEIFAALALVLSAIGIYGVLNFWVSVRQKEISIRLAIGAPRAAILRWTGWHAVRLILPGVALGLLGCVAASRSLESLVFGIAPRSAATMIVAVAVVIAIASVAAGLPAWRASRIDPIRNLRSQPGDFS